MAHTERAELLQKLDDVANRIEIGKHYDIGGSSYEVIGFGINEDSEAVVVEYRQTGEPSPIPLLCTLSSEGEWLPVEATEEPEVLLRRLGDASIQVEVGGRYVHYKAPESIYSVSGFAIDTNTGNVRVKYQRIDEDPPIPWRRELMGENGWLTTVTLSDGQETSRFTKVN